MRHATRYLPKLLVAVIVVGVADAQELVSSPTAYQVHPAVYASEASARPSVDRVPKPCLAPGPASWDWESDQVYTLYAAAKGQSYNVRLPYHSSNFPSAPSITPASVRKRDGWVLLTRNFGCSEAGVSLPHFVLYNKYTGTIRFFGYNSLTSNTYSTAMVGLSTNGSLSDPALFTGHKYDPPMTEVTSVTRMTPYAWFYADFEASNYVDVSGPDYKDAVFTFNVYGINRSDITINGTLNLEAVMTEGTSGSFLTGVGSFLSSGPFTTAAGAIKSFGSVNALSEESGFLTTITAISSFIPAAGKFVAAIGSLSGGGSAPTLKGFTGELSLTGNLQTVQQYQYINVRVPGTQRSNGNFRTAYSEPLGVSTTPASIEAELAGGGIGPCDPTWGCGTITEHKVDISDIQGEVGINPALLPPGVTADLSYAIVVYDFFDIDNDGPWATGFFESLAALDSKRFYCSSHPLLGPLFCGPGQVAVKIEFEGSAPPDGINFFAFDSIWVTGLPQGGGYSGETPPPLTSGAPSASVVGEQAVGTPASVRDASSTQADELRVFPNPASDRVTLSTGGCEGEVVYRVLDARGRAVTDGRLACGSESVLSVESLPTGPYFVVLENRDRTVARFTKL